MENAAPGENIQPEEMLLILAKSERSVRSTIAFLNRRGIPTLFISTLNDAIEAFTAKKASKLLLSVNFPHPKIEMIPVLMQQSFPIECIVFAEETDRKSSQRLQNAKTKHVLMGPVSGPAVMMKVRQIEKDANADSGSGTGEAGTRSSARSIEQDQSINVRGSSGAQTKQDALASLLSAARDPLLDEHDGTHTSSLERSGETYVQKGSRTGSHLVTPEEALRALLENGLEEPTRPNPKLIIPLPVEMRKQNAAAKKEAYRRKQQAAETFDGLSEEEKSAREERLKPLVSAPRKKASSDEEDLFLNCILGALETVAGEPDDRLSTLLDFDSSMLVAVRSKRLRGAFLIAMGKSKYKPATLMERIQVAFFSLLRANGIELEGEEQFAIQLDHLSLSAAAFESSSHVLVTRTEETEIGVAVVAVADPVPAIVPYEMNMLQVPLASIPPGEAITFNVYLHLKRNNRFLRYVKVGAKISDRQVSRLKKREITHVLVDGKEKEAYSRHFAAHSLQPNKRRMPAA